MDMKKMALLGLLVLAMGCRREDKGPQNFSNLMSPNCNAAVTNYSGAIATTCLRTGVDDQGITHCVLVGQDVAINADVMTYPYQHVQVALCTEDGCVVRIPSSHISLGHNLVRFVDVDQPFQTTVGGPIRHYLSYNIATTTCS